MQNTILPLIPIFFILFSLLFRIFSLGAVDLLVEEAYYWNYAQHLDWSYLDHPPLVAVLIKLSTMLWGTSEWAVRFPALLCWFGTSFYSYRLTRLMFNEGWISVFLLSILPFFFLQSWVMTPDQPLLFAWSAVLYYLYLACVLNQTRAWFAAGVALGLGLLAKYTIVLLIPATALFLLLHPSARSWFLKPTPYVALLIAAVLFLPVIYWNATHDWASFAFQSSRRFNQAWHFTFHQVVGLLLLFVMPAGLRGLWSLVQARKGDNASAASLFLCCMLLVPLSFFSLFSLMHPVKFNWIGPSLLALIPWLAFEFKTYQKFWLFTATLLMSLYCTMLMIVVTGYPTIIYQKLFNKFINWQHFSEVVFQNVKRIEQDTHSRPIVVALDKYNIASELAFYQAKLSPNNRYEIRGSDLFGGESLMYRYWNPKEQPVGRVLLLVTDNPLHFQNPAIELHTQTKSKVMSLQGVSQGVGVYARPYFFQHIQFF